ncbi:MAG: hypothetical protein JWO67_1522 [Streptosporangiaceae bacterium]|nr:hypothetical protein [Streptosporangiaceae bacterium]
MSPTDTAGRPASGAAQEGSRVVRAVIWLPGLAVALGAAVATAHGLYEVAHAARVPAAIAWLYPLITDGLALVAYAATARLHGSAARYAWGVVVLAAGLSGLAQAVFLASGSAVDASPALRFGVGAWPAIAAAIVAHLLYLLAVDAPEPSSAAEPVQASGAGVQPGTARGVQAPTPGPVQSPAEVRTSTRRAALAPAPAEQPARTSGASPVRDRARVAATRHASRHGHLPTVTDLQAAAQVSRGTAAAVLKDLRAQPTPLHLITRTTDQPEPSEHDDPTIEKASQP